MLLIAFENKSVRMFESGNGHFCHEFFFYDNSETNNINEDQLKKIKEQKKREDDEYETKKANMTKFEFSHLKRKEKREKGTYRPEIPAMTGFEKIAWKKKEDGKNQQKIKSTYSSNIDDMEFFKQASRSGPMNL